VADFKCRLAGGIRKNIGFSDDVAAEVQQNPKKLAELIECCKSSDSLLQMRAFDALEKALRKNPSLDTPQSQSVLLSGLTHPFWEVRIQCIRGISLCKWSDPTKIAAEVTPLLNDEAKFVRAWAIDTAVQLARQDNTLTKWAEDAIQTGLNSRFPSIVKRAQKSAQDLP
jgi:hypothetical protein